MNVSVRRLLIEVSISAAAGLAVTALPVLLDTDHVKYRAAFLPDMRDVVEGMKPYSLILLFTGGLVIGFIGCAPVWLVGPATMLAFPLWSAVDMASGGDHNLFPIEWFLYGLYSLIGWLGALIGRAAKQRNMSRISSRENNINKPIITPPL